MDSTRFSRRARGRRGRLRFSLSFYIFNNRRDVSRAIDVRGRVVGRAGIIAAKVITRARLAENYPNDASARHSRHVHIYLFLFPTCSFFLLLCRFFLFSRSAHAVSIAGSLYRGRRICERITLPGAFNVTFIVVAVNVTANAHYRRYYKLLLL